MEDRMSDSKVNTATKQTSEEGAGDILQKFKSSAAAMRPVASPFPGTYTSFSYKTGKFEAGKNKADLGDRPLLAVVTELIATWRRYSNSERRFFYSNSGYVRAGHVLTESSHPQPDREDLKWTPTWVLMALDQESREQFSLALSSTSGKEDALAALQNSFADHNAGRDRLDWEEPIVSLASEAYTKADGKQGYRPIINVEGWATTPAWLRAPRLPTDEKETANSSDDFGQDIPF
jgi:hypothetical protein